MVISVQSLSYDWLLMTPWTAAHQASLSITNSQSLLKLMSVKSMMPSIRLILCHSLLPLPSIFPRIKVFSNESVLPIRWPQYWSFSFSISPSKEYSGLISFRMDWLDVLAVQGTLKSFYSIDDYSLCILHHPCSQEIIKDSAEDPQRTVRWTRTFCLVCSYLCWPIVWFRSLCLPCWNVELYIGVPNSHTTKRSLLRRPKKWIPDWVMRQTAAP